MESNIAIQDQYSCDELFRSNIEMFSQFIPKFQTQEMINKIIEKDQYYLLKYCPHLSQEICDLVVKYQVENIQYIPKENIVDELAYYVVEEDPSLLQFCPNIDRKLMMHIFRSKKMSSLPRIDRYNFIIDFDEDVLVKIVKAIPNVFRVLPQKRKTDKIIKTVLSEDGYCIQYVENKTKEYTDIAIKKSPGAKKYL